MAWVAGSRVSLWRAASAPPQGRVATANLLGGGRRGAGGWRWALPPRRKVAARPEAAPPGSCCSLAGSWGCRGCQGCSQAPQVGALIPASCWLHCHSQQQRKGRGRGSRGEGGGGGAHKGCALATGACCPSKRSPKDPALQGVCELPQQRRQVLLVHGGIEERDITCSCAVDVVEANGGWGGRGGQGGWQDSVRPTAAGVALKIQLVSEALRAPHRGEAGIDVERGAATGCEHNGISCGIHQQSQGDGQVSISASH